MTRTPGVVTRHIMCACIPCASRHKVCLRLCSSQSCTCWYKLHMLVQFALCSCKLHIHVQVAHTCATCTDEQVAHVVLCNLHMSYRVQCNLYRAQAEPCVRFRALCKLHSTTCATCTCVCNLHRHVQLAQACTSCTQTVQLAQGCAYYTIIIGCH